MEGHGDANCSLLGYKCVSLQLGLIDILTDASVLCEQSGPMLTWNISVMLWQHWAELGLKSGLIGNLSMDNNPYNKRGFYHATLHFDHGNVLYYQQGLDQANWDGSISVLILLYVSNEKC